jgi:hypothetical protein
MQCCGANAVRVTTQLFARHLPRMTTAMCRKFVFSRIKFQVLAFHVMWLLDHVSLFEV